VRRATAVICILHGIAFGLAIDISCCADVRLCVKDTRFAVKEVDIGLAADIGTLARLPKVVGSGSWVKEVCLSAREFGAAEALAVGFVSEVHESKAAAVAAALKLASLIASKSPVAVQGTKELLNHARDHAVDESMLLAFAAPSRIGRLYWACV
jgi:delta(3,5)-delta(2,4)-dienoyl-CoA isomerase